MQQRHQEELPKRYIEILPNGQQRIIEEYSAPPRYAPVQYIQPPPRDDRYGDRRGYYVEAPPLPRERETQYVDITRDAVGLHTHLRQWKM